MDPQLQAFFDAIGWLIRAGLAVFAVGWMIVMASRLNRIGKRMALFHGDVARFLNLELDRTRPRSPQEQPPQTDRPPESTQA